LEKLPLGPHFRNSKAWDFLAATPLIVLCLFGAAGFIIMIYRQWPVPQGVPSVLLLVSRLCSAGFLAFQAALLMVRRLPVARMPGIAPRVWALLGANFTFLILLVPLAHPSPLLASVSSLLMVIGAASSIWTLTSLGKSFAIFPQARNLVTDGPYRWVRHPLYLSEQISAFGLALQYHQPWGLLIVSAGLFFQLPRMHFEEEVLAASYESYRGYRSRTASLIPGLY
jgi:protein-S-isoprenylcysteine O-methyltransferase Ste14